MSAPTLPREASTDVDGQPPGVDEATDRGHPAEAPGRGSRSSAWMAVAALVVAVLATPFGTEIGRADFGRLLEGRLEVRTDEGWVGLAEDADVPTDRLVRAAGEPARISVSDTELVLADGAELATDADDPELLRGSLLVDAAESWAVRLGAARAEGSGQWRVDMGVASRVATYRGRVEIDDGARSASLARFRQVPVRDGALEDGRRPLRYLVGDPWDESLLAEAFAVDRLAERLTEALARTHGAAPRSPAFYEAFAAVDAEVDAALDELATMEEDGRYGPPADVLLAVAVIDALVEETGHDPGSAVERMVALRRSGATWGLVLVEHDLDAAALRAAADRALERVEDSPPPPEADPGPTGEEAPTPGTPDEGGGTDTGGQAPAPAPQPSPSPQPSSSPPSAGEEDDDPGGPLEPVEDTVRDLGEDVGDLLTDTSDTVGDVVGELDGLLSPSNTDAEADGPRDDGLLGDGLLGD